jgi:murein tripeptide amidase MpaA
MTFLNVAEIESALVGLASAYPTLAELITLPFFTAEGRQSHAIRMGSKQCYRRTVLIISGTHAREWGGPDICINLVADLLEAWVNGTGLSYGGTSYSAGQLQQVLDGVELIVFPDINPDGRNYSQTSYAMWRKNRSGTGVDLNRNYDFLWNFPVAFSPSAQAAGTLASNDPNSDLYHGTGPFSEAETKNVRWLYEQYPNISRFIDIHSYGGDILHPWGDDENQNVTSSMNFLNGAWNGQRGLKADTYREFITPSDLASLQSAGNAMRAAIGGVRGQSYTLAQSFFLPGWTTYPTSGASDDWAFSRHYSNPYQTRVLGYTIEFNKTWTFFPAWTEMENIILDVDAGLVAFCLDAAPKVQRWFHWCWWREWIDKVLWRRLFPPDIWGPYGPWGRVMPAVKSILTVIGIALVLRFVERLFRRR